MENIVSEASDFNKIQKNKSDLKINDLPKNKSQEKLQKCNTFRKVCQKNSPTIFKERDFNVIRSQEGISYNINNRFSFKLT